MTPIPLITYAEGPLVVGQTLYSYTSSVALNLISYRTLMRSGTSVSIEVRKTGTLLDVLEITTLDSGVVAIPNLFFGDQDVLTLVVSAAVGSPTGVSITFQCTVADAVDRSAVQLARRMQTPLVARFEGSLVDETSFFKFVPSQQIGVFGYTISLRTAADADVVVDLQQAGTTVAQLTLASGSLVATGALAAYFNANEELSLKITSIGGALPGVSLQVLLDYSNIQQTSFSSFQTPLIVEFEDIQASSTTMLRYALPRAVTLAVGQLFSRTAPKTSSLATIDVGTPGTRYLVGDSVTLSGSSPAIVSVTALQVVSVVMQAPGTGMSPGTVLTLGGGTGTVAATITLTAVKVVGATVQSHGTAVDGTYTVTGTTGTATILFQASVTYTGGVATVDSITVAGLYTTNPADINAEPVSGTPVGLVLAVVMGAAGGSNTSVSNGGSYTTSPSTVAGTVASGGGNDSYWRVVAGVKTVTSTSSGTYTDPLPSSFTQASTTSANGTGVTFVNPTWTATNVPLFVGLYRNSALITTLSLAAGVTTSTPVELSTTLAAGDILEARLLTVATHDGLLLTLDYFIEVGEQAASFDFYSDPQYEIILLARQIGIGGTKADSIPLENLRKYQEDVDSLLNGRLRALYRTPLAKVARGLNPWPGAVQTIAQRLVLQRLLNDIFSDIEPNASANVAANAKLATDDLQQILDRFVLLEGQKLRAKNYGSNPYSEALGVGTPPTPPTSPS